MKEGEGKRQQNFGLCAVSAYHFPRGLFGNQIVRLTLKHLQIPKKVRQTENVLENYQNLPLMPKGSQGWKSGDTEVNQMEMERKRLETELEKIKSSGRKEQERWRKAVAKSCLGMVLALKVPDYLFTKSNGSDLKFPQYAVYYVPGTNGNQRPGAQSLSMRARAKRIEARWMPMCSFQIVPSPGIGNVEIKVRRKLSLQMRRLMEAVKISLLRSVQSNFTGWGGSRHCRFDPLVFPSCGQHISVAV